MTPARYAIYYLPPQDAPWAELATAWLGWDCYTGRAVAPPDLGLPADDIASVTATPRRYGLHATLKPPFRLADGTDYSALHDACANLSAALAPAHADGLALAKLGRFFALRPEGDASAINDLAAACVTSLDGFRAPASDTEIAKRRTTRLSPEQDAHLMRWGYPYVLDQFRFHVTLTERLAPLVSDTVEHALRTHLVPLLPGPFTISHIALAGEDDKGRFHHLHSFRLGG